MNPTKRLDDLVPPLGPIDEDDIFARAAGVRRRRRGVVMAGFVVAALALIVLVVPRLGGHDAVPAAPPSDSSTPSITPRGAPHDLLTHCGIHETFYKGKSYLRRGGRLDDGNGNPPSGWRNPMQPGYVVVEGRVLIFTDDAGHREVFDERTSASPTLPACA